MINFDFTEEELKEIEKAVSPQLNEKQMARLKEIKKELTIANTLKIKQHYSGRSNFVTEVTALSNSMEEAGTPEPEDTVALLRLVLGDYFSEVLESLNDDFQEATNFAMGTLPKG